MKKLLLIALTALFFIGCDEETGNNPDANGFSNEINEIFPQDVLDEFENNGMIFNKGLNPPVLSNIYLVSPNYLQESTNYDDEYYFYYNERIFPDIKVKFSNYNRDNKSIDIQTTQISNEVVTFKGYISGSGVSFTIFGKYVSPSGMEALFVYSGTLGNQTIKDWQHGVYMLNNQYYPDAIDNGALRIFIDYDKNTTITNSI
jgi:hypothetical protein